MPRNVILLTDVVCLNRTIYFVHFLILFNGIWEVGISHTGESVSEMTNELEVGPLRDVCLSHN